MSQPCRKRRCRRIDKALSELETLSLSKDYDKKYGHICAVLQFILKEYCQRIEDLVLLSESDFKDYFLIIISAKQIGSDLASILLSILHNSSKLDEFFDDLISSSIFDKVIHHFLHHPENYYRSLRFLSVSLSKDKGRFILPLDRLDVIVQYCTTHSTQNKDLIPLASEIISFITFYIKKHLKENWSEFIEEHDVVKLSSNLTGILHLDSALNFLKPREAFQLSRVLLSTLLHTDTPLNIKELFKDNLTFIISWLTNRKTSECANFLTDLFQPEAISTICYLSERSRNGCFSEVLAKPPPNDLHLKIVRIYLLFCKEGSYRTHFIDQTICKSLVSLVSNYCKLTQRNSLSEKKIVRTFEICNLVLSIFFNFNSGERLIQIATTSGLVSGIFIMFNYILNLNQTKRSEEIVSRLLYKEILFKSFIVLRKTQTFTSIQEVEIRTLVYLLQRFKGLNCYNFLLHLALEANYIQLCRGSFATLVFCKMNCCSLSLKELSFYHKPLKSTNGFTKTIPKFPHCGMMILSNFMSNFDPTSLSCPDALPDSLLLLRQPKHIKQLFKRNSLERLINNMAHDKLGLTLQNILILTSWYVPDTSLVVNYLCGSPPLQQDSVVDTSVCITNGRSKFDVTKVRLMKSSFVLERMFYNNFKENVNNCIHLHYLSDKAIDWLQNLFSEDFSNLENYTWSCDVAIELLSFCSIFECKNILEHLKVKFFGCHITQFSVPFFESSVQHCQPLWALFLDKKVFNLKFDSQKFCKYLLRVNILNVYEFLESVISDK